MSYKGVVDQLKISTKWLKQIVNSFKLFLGTFAKPDCHRELSAAISF